MSVSNESRRTFIAQLASLAAAAAAGLMHTSRVFAQAVSNGLATIAGTIIRRGEESYLSWWSSMSWYIFKPPRYPDMIVRAESDQAVIDTVNYARANGLRIALRSTGHNPAKSALRNDGILLDLTTLREVEINAADRTAWVQPGIRAGEFLGLTTQHGLAFPAAHTGMVGLGGYLPGGGLGWNMPEYGIACRSILTAEIITADGRKLLASKEQNPDLLWAVRGVGPGFFGVILRYKVQLYPAHTAIEASTYVIPVERLPEALKAFEQIGSGSQQRLEILIKIGRFHPQEKPYAERDLVCVAQFFAFADSPEEARELVSPVAASRLPELSILSQEHVPLTYRELYIPPDTDISSSGRTTVENMWTDDPAIALQRLADKMVAEPPRSPRSFVLCGWSFNSVFDDPSSCVMTGGRHYMSWYMIAETEDDIEPNYVWMDDAVAVTRPVSKGRYINEIDSVRYPQHVEECFSPADWKRLQELRTQYDPQGVFHGYVGLGW